MIYWETTGKHPDYRLPGDQVVWPEYLSRYAQLGDIVIIGTHWCYVAKSGYVQITPEANEPKTP